MGRLSFMSVTSEIGMFASCKIYNTYFLLFVIFLTAWLSAVYQVLPIVNDESIQFFMQCLVYIRLNMVATLIDSFRNPYLQRELKPSITCNPI